MVTISKSERTVACSALRGGGSCETPSAALASVSPIAWVVVMFLACWMSIASRSASQLSLFSESESSQECLLCGWGWVSVMVPGRGLEVFPAVLGWINGSSGPWLWLEGDMRFVE